ncbi:WXG100 family type VII secretion target [Embleya sp. NPDC020886]|uniref:WXG100 family type VII secretion target n=1 Tax=Embleya sp. NPDC020886 TaxID=3363980 RepID=UPI00378C9A92
MGSNSIPDCPVVTDLIPGDPSVLEVLAESFALYSSSSAESAARMRPPAKVEEWGGPAAKGFVGQMEDLPKTMDKAVRHFTDAANALRGYAGALRQAQADVAARVIPEANAARAWSAQWQVDRAAAANGAVGLSLPDKDLGRERLKDAEDELGWSGDGCGVASW